MPIVIINHVLGKLKKETKRCFTLSSTFIPFSLIKEKKMQCNYFHRFFSFAQIALMQRFMSSVSPFIYIDSHSRRSFILLWTPCPMYNTVENNFVALASGQLQSQCSSLSHANKQCHSLSWQPLILDLNSLFHHLKNQSFHILIQWIITLKLLGILGRSEK